MSTLEIDFCNQSIIIDVFGDETIDLVDFYQDPSVDLIDSDNPNQIDVVDFFDVLTIAIPDDFTGQDFSIVICDDFLDIAVSDATAVGFLSIRDRFNALIYDRFNDHINMRAA